MYFSCDVPNSPDVLPLFPGTCNTLCVGPGLAYGIICNRETRFFNNVTQMLKGGPPGMATDVEKGHVEYTMSNVGHKWVVTNGVRSREFTLQ